MKTRHRTKRPQAMRSLRAVTRLCTLRWDARLLNRRLGRLRHDDLRRDVGPGRRHGRDQLGQGFPDTDGPEEVTSPPRRRSRPATTSTRRDRESRCCGEAIAAAPAAVLRPRL